ncbi:leucine-rich repeat and WD repeat-containing protein 1-like [Cimex lectularius]|uniref:Leucine-rich repeat and WD repeat-containing protein 1 WD domain-containing protein n=1 Tax=Cimex lectularius TaxID=79782 RepID=A0A8I6TLF9_CIMLE|nr:leucine-rich repeat and WD repeat-containing protein 1-like [Cimex lectularius]
MMTIGHFEPAYFLRCHSKNKDSADVQTQVWHCSFEPSVDSISSRVATCGGNSVCVIDCNSGSVLSKFYTKTENILFALAWGTICINRRPSNVIMCGGAKATIYTLDPTSNKCLLVHSFVQNRNKISLNSLVFHPREKSIFFCALSDGEIKCCEVLEDENRQFFLTVYNELSTSSEIFDLSFCIETQSLFASFDQGLHLFHFKDGISFKCKNRPEHKILNLPKNPNSVHSQTDTKLVDSVESLNDGFFACKCALHGKIYICDTKPIIKTNSNIVDITPVKILNWSLTDNYFMYMGVSPDKTILGCGDDKGALWLYDLCNETSIKDADIIIPWPSLIDHYNDKKRKLALQTYDIVVDKIAISFDKKYIVAVTNNNFVCIWKNTEL